MTPKSSQPTIVLNSALTLPLPQQHKNLPLEILLTIIHLLAKPELVQCCQVSQYFNFVALPYLYKELHIDPAKPGLYATLPVVIPETQVGSREGSPALPLNGTVHQLEAQDVPRSDIQHARFSFTTHLTITPHPQSLCDLIPPLVLPNLITLRMIGFKPSLSATLAATCPDTICPFLARLQPRRIIVDSDVSRRLPSMTSGRCNPPNSAIELVIIVKPNDELDLASCVRGMIASVEHITLVMRPGPQRGLGVAIYANVDSWRKGRSWLAAIVEACRGRTRQITVVNLQWAGRERSMPNLRLDTGWLRAAARRLMEESGMSEEDAASKIEGIRFVDLEDYDGEV